MRKPIALTIGLFLLSLSLMMVSGTVRGMIVTMADTTESKHGSGHVMMGTMTMHNELSEPVTAAVCVLAPTAGSKVSGIVRFKQMEKGMRITARVEGLTPGKHGFHIHEFGDLTSSDGTSAGGHFNPMKQDHAGPDAEMRHPGDLGNLVADENGVANYDWTDPSMMFEGPLSILGRGVVVHADEDDFSTQPTGAAGARVAVGVIGVTE